MFASLLLLAAAQAAAPAPAPAADQNSAAKMECRNVTEPGSRIPSRVCKPHGEWEAMAKAAEQDMRNSRNQHGEGYNPE